MSEDKVEYGSNPLAIISQAVGSGANPDVLDKLMTLQERYSANEARAAFNRAVVDFQTRCPIIAKRDRGDKSQYAAIDRIWREIRPLMHECGLAVIFHVCAVNDDAVHLEGCLMHRDGHSVPLSSTIPLPDKIVSREGRSVQNAAQRAGSGETYAKRRLICASLGIQTGVDDDGAGGQKPADAVKPATLKQLKTLIADKGVDVKAILTWAKVAKIEDISEDQAQGAIKRIRSK